MGFKHLPFLPADSMRICLLVLGVTFFQISKCQVPEFLSAPVLYYTNLKDYTEEVAKCLLEGILEGKREIKKREEREKQEIKNFEERRLAREFELERLRAQLRRDKGGTNNEGLICENICEEKYTIGTLMGCEKQLTVNRESFRNHTMAEIAGQLNGEKENMCKADVEEGLGDRVAMHLPLSEPWEIYKDSLETDNRSNIG
ncbi:uncharacterized protein TNCV_2587091 [Trichonephila clavipes]|nr:uncharacterized protein TNCV_2587091 [Trichonephila clavipes]